jgi:hypothetical protein
LRKKAAAKKIKKYMFFKTALLYTEIRKPIKNGESFILDTAFKNDYQVEWLFVSNRINHRVSYNKANIANIDMQFHYSGTFVDTSSILIADEFMGKQVVIITDGTDMFDFPFNKKLRRLV